MTLVWRPGFQFDADASTYIEAVEAADTQALETGVRYAINNFVIGCKNDGIWSAIKASCILAGARTTNGALVPLVGTAPTPYNFDLVGDTDYDRKTGLKGDGTTKYLDSNAISSSFANTNTHLAVFLSSFGSASNRFYISAQDAAGVTTFLSSVTTFASAIHNRYVNFSAGVGFVGASSTVSSTIGRSAKANTFAAAPVSTMAGLNYFVFAQNNNNTPANYAYSSSRLAFYSIGESLDLAKLDARVTDLITAIGAAIP